MVFKGVLLWDWFHHSRQSVDFPTIPGIIKATDGCLDDLPVILFTLKHGRGLSQGVSHPLEKPTLREKHLDSLERIHPSLLANLSTWLGVLRFQSNESYKMKEKQDGLDVTQITTGKTFLYPSFSLNSVLVSWQLVCPWHGTNLTASRSSHTHVAGSRPHPLACSCVACDGVPLLPDQSIPFVNVAEMDTPGSVCRDWQLVGGGWPWLSARPSSTFLTKNLRPSVVEHTVEWVEESWGVVVRLRHTCGVGSSQHLHVDEKCVLS